MKYKKIYIEITNICNLNCSFCSKDKRNKKEMMINEFDYVLKSINNYTDNISLHIKGEPLLHSKLDDIFSIARNYNKKINLTTNGTLLSKRLDIILKNSDVIRQINISLHSFINTNSDITSLFNIIDTIIDKSNIIISYRLWNKNSKENNTQIFGYISSYYDIDCLEDGIKLKNNLYLNLDNRFIWPSLDNDYYSEIGKCYGLIHHFGILSNGDIIPCCLDSDGMINLGNIFKDGFDSIINSKRVLDIIDGFKNNRKCEELCKHCNFILIKHDKE